MNLTKHAATRSKQRGIPNDVLAVINNFGRTDHINILCESQTNPSNFKYLKVPFVFLRENRGNFDIRQTGEKFDLHISAKKLNFMIDERSKNVHFKQFEVV